MDLLSPKPLDEKAKSESKSDPKDYKIPLALLGLGLAIYFLRELISGGIPGVKELAVFLPVYLGVQAVLGIIACVLTSRIMGTAFGYITTAFVKLAAIFIFPNAVSFLIPSRILGGIVALVLYWGLLEWLFELDGLETIVLAIVIWCVGVGAFFLVSAIGFALN